jgi:hypothetical protein
MYTHLATKVVIGIIAINLINGDRPSIFGFQVVNYVFQVLAIPAPGGEKLQNCHSLVTGLWIDD